jgi:hypothetical protein
MKLSLLFMTPPSRQPLRFATWKPPVFRRVPSASMRRGSMTGSTTTTTAAPHREQGLWASLFGGEPEYEHDTTVYNRSLESGSTVVSVKASELHVTQAMEILERHNPIDINERATSYRVTK